jgi:hypothetical protein
MEGDGRGSNSGTILKLNLASEKPMSWPILELDISGIQARNLTTEVKLMSVVLV